MARHDDVIKITASGSNKGVCEFLAIFVGLRRQLVRIGGILAEDDARRALWPHHRNLGTWPGIIDVTTQMFRGHHIIGAAIGLAGDQRHLRHRRLGVGKQQFRAVRDDPACFLRQTRHETRHIDKRHQRDVEGVTEPDKPRRLARGVDIKTPGQHHRLVPDNPDRAAVNPPEADNDVGGKGLVDLEKLGIIDNLQNHLAHVIGGIGIVRDDRIEDSRRAVDRVMAGHHGCRLTVRQRQIGDQRAGAHQHLDVILEGTMRHARSAAVHLGPAKLLGGEILMRHCLHHVRAGDEHVARPLDHEDEIGDRRRVDGATGTGPHDQRDLRHHTRGQHIALEHFGITAKRGNAFLDAGTAGVIQPDQRNAGLDRLVHDLADFRCMRFRQRAAKNGEILRIDKDRPAGDCAISGDHTIAGHLLVFHAEIMAAMLDEHVPFLERGVVQKQNDALTRCQLAFAMLGVDAALATTEARLFTLGLEFGENIGHQAFLETFIETVRKLIGKPRGGSMSFPRRALPSSHHAGALRISLPCSSSGKSGQDPAHSPVWQTAYPPPCRTRHLSLPGAPHQNWPASPVRALPASEPVMRFSRRQGAAATRLHGQHESPAPSHAPFQPAFHR
uniref:Predicted acetyl-CoA carboxylase n=1 Tax=uncultured bacterium MedeBAC46A06 TaxID=332275 RepID=Q4PJD9_9BACT|nr:predicted acetyl-CoA carboxylase [uncultured bacterium MedeBAC46A06]